MPQGLKAHPTATLTARLEAAPFQGKPHQLRFRFSAVPEGAGRVWLSKSANRCRNIAADSQGRRALSMYF